MSAYAGLSWNERDDDPPHLEEPTAGDAMTSDITVMSPLGTIQETVHVLRETGFDRIAVFDGPFIVGTLGWHEVERCLAERPTDGLDVLVRDVMCRLSFHPRISDRLFVVRRIMRRYGLLWVPILDERGKLAGVLSALSPAW